MLKSIKVTFFLVFTVCLGTAPWGDLKAQSENLGWKRLRIQQASRVVLIQGAEHKLWVDGKEHLPKPKESNPEADAMVDGEWLQVSVLTAKEIRIQQPRLLELQLRGAVAVHSQGLLREDLLRIELSGVGQVVMDLEVGELLADLRGLGRMEFKGKADNIRLEINGPGMVEARQLKVRRAQIFIDGLGLCRLDVSDSLLADISGGGSIRYRKEPRFFAITYATSARDIRQQRIGNIQAAQSQSINKNLGATNLQLPSFDHPRPVDFQSNVIGLALELHPSQTPQIGQQFTNLQIHHHLAHPAEFNS